MQQNLTIVSTITSKGQVTIPARVRRHLGVKTRDKIAFVLEPAGMVRLKTPRFTTIASLRGAAGSLRKLLRWEQMRTIARNEQLGIKYKKRL